mmetsp:Transcript_11439/g.22792  ORF Transcript_11439/g.22792 Transcript_11439/m.22792 type:complete len:214 (+) Transcript_11439:2-643(+)
MDPPSSGGQLHKQASYRFLCDSHLADTSDFEAPSTCADELSSSHASVKSKSDAGGMASVLRTLRKTKFILPLSVSLSIVLHFVFFFEGINLDPLDPANSKLNDYNVLETSPLQLPKWNDHFDFIAYCQNFGCQNHRKEGQNLQNEGNVINDDANGHASNKSVNKTTFLETDGGCKTLWFAGMHETLGDCTYQPMYGAALNSALLMLVTRCTPC